jgi:hypothetical protein
VLRDGVTSDFDAVGDSSNRLAAGGELRPPRTGGYTSALPVEAQEIVRRWLDDGGYGRALEVVALEDPDLANR